MCRTLHQYIHIQSDKTLWFLSGTSPRKYMPVYSKPLTLNKGVDNQLQFQFLNQEQKPVDLSSIATANQQISFRAINSDGTEILLRKALTPVLDVNGIFVLKQQPLKLKTSNAQKCYYSLEWPSGNLNLPVFVDSKAGARGDLNIVDSVLPSFVASQTLLYLVIKHSLLILLMQIQKQLHTFQVLLIHKIVLC